jgi:hypothetical protein
VLHVIVEKCNDRKLFSIATAAVILVFAIAAHAQSPQSSRKLAMDQPFFEFDAGAA